MTASEKSQARAMMREAMRIATAPTLTITQALKVESEDRESDELTYLMVSNGRK